MSMFREPLLLRALAALCEIADHCGAEPAQKKLSLRFILAYTFVAAGADPGRKWIWNSFWEHATARCDPMRPMDDYLRGTGVRSAFSGICREVGYPPDGELLEMLRTHRRVRGSTGGQPAEPPLPANDEPGGRRRGLVPGAPASSSGSSFLVPGARSLRARSGRHKRLAWTASVTRARPAVAGERNFVRCSIRASSFRRRM
jgi:hypothetical protein